MIRLYNSRCAETAADVTMLSERFIFDKNLWRKVRECFRRNVSNDALDFQLISIENEQHEVICQAWQDNEANRELRMLKELEENRNPSESACCVLIPGGNHGQCLGLPAG